MGQGVLGPACVMLLAHACLGSLRVRAIRVLGLGLGLGLGSCRVPLAVGVALALALALCAPYHDFHAGNTRQEKTLCLPTMPSMSVSHGCCFGANPLHRPCSSFHRSTSQQARQTATFPRWQVEADLKWWMNIEIAFMVKIVTAPWDLVFALRIQVHAPPACMCHVFALRIQVHAPPACMCHVSSFTV